MAAHHASSTLANHYTSMVFNILSLLELFLITTTFHPQMRNVYICLEEEQISKTREKMNSATVILNCIQSRPTVKA